MAQDNSKLLNDLNDEMVSAAKNGFINLVRFCKSLGATEINQAMINAAAHGHTKIVKQCIEWGATSFDAAIKGVPKDKYQEIRALLQR